MNGNQQDPKITVRPLDYELHERVMELLEKLNLSGIHFNIEQGVVTLEGEVGDPLTIEKVEDKIKDIPGVKDIQNDLFARLH